MSNELFTPITLWEDFALEHSPIIEPIGEFVSGDVVLSRFYIKGRTLSDGEVKIYAVLAKNKLKSKMPAVFVLQDFKDAADETFITYLAERGYAALTFDYAGDSGINGNHSVYPASLSGINYKNCFNSLNTVEGDAKSTPWYEWGVTTRYAFDYLKSLDFVTKIGAIGIGDSATLLWHLSATENKLDCASFVLNAGWKAYHGMNKFKMGEIPEFSTEQLKYLACIEPQSYASHVKCPSLVLVATNSNKFDFDRAYDTLTRINSSVYSSIDYSVDSRDCINADGVKTMEIFLSKFLKNSKDDLPSETDIDGEIVNGELKVTVKPDAKNLEAVYLYVAEQSENPALRCWKVLTDGTINEDGSITFSFVPYKDSEQVMFFARTVYKSGFGVGSCVLCRKIKPEDVSNSYKSNVIYSSRTENGKGLFTSARENKVKPSGLCIGQDNEIKVKKGPMDIGGICCYGGLLSFSLSIEKYKPKTDAVLMCDVYALNDSVLTVKLISDFTGQRIEYISTKTVKGANVWHNLKFEISDFKTQEGMGLKSFDKINAVFFDAIGEHLINNVIWA